MKFLLTLILFILLGNVFIAHAQKSITIDVEDLKKPTGKLEVSTYKDILKSLIQEDSHVTEAVGERHIEPYFNVIAKNSEPDSLVSFGYHSFFEGMYNAYAQHRPFTLSPDMVWLLICQGFAAHVNNNSESLRGFFMGFKGKTTLVVKNNGISLKDPNSPWLDVFPEFSKQISDYTGKQLTETLTANFTTTTVITKMASQITLMNATKSYFDFIIIRIACGIPQITLEGSTDDWQKLLTKTEALRKYKLDWWVDEMEPILKKIVSASNGEVDKTFWQDMFKSHSRRTCGAPTTVDGWIVKFFPYNKDGKRNDLKSINLKNVLPDEIVKVDLQYEEGDGKGSFVTTPLELWAGFIGLKQNNKTFNLKPEIGWMIRKKDKGTNETLKARFKYENSSDDFSGDLGGIKIRTKTVPKELLEIGPIRLLEIHFIDNIQIPDEMRKIKIGTLKLYGTIDNTEINRLSKLFPGTMLIINGKQIAGGKTVDVL